MPTSAPIPPSAIPGYRHGDPALPTSPVSLADLDALQRTLLLDADDLAALRASRVILADQVEAILDVWYGFVGATPELLHSFRRSDDGQPDAAYLVAVRRRFGQWILDTADARFDQAWLDWQHEIGLRHAPAKKNQTDGVRSAALVPMRYLIALSIPVTTTLKPFLAAGGDAADQVERMHAAWVKAVLLQVILWCQPYVRDGQF